jgi:type I restriction enzyme S subunit
MIGRYGPPLFQILRGLEGAYNVALIKAVPDEDVLMKEYLYHFLRERRLHDLIDHLSARSAGQAGVEMSVLVNYPIPVPQLSVQKEIAATLGEIDAQITAIDTRVATMQRLRNSLVSAVLGREAS